MWTEHSIASVVNISIDMTLTFLTAMKEHVVYERIFEQKHRLQSQGLTYGVESGFVLSAKPYKAFICLAWKGRSRRMQ